MNLESLANELLLDLFEYLDAINLVHAFHSLNNRFDRLLFIILQRYYLDFRSVSKCNFESFCQRYLPSINDRIISFHLSNDLETPDLIQVFFSNGYRINQFRHLKSLSIDYIDSFDLLNQTTSQCRELSYLTHLSITINTDEDRQENFRDFINHIWSLSSLTHCCLDINYRRVVWLLKMSTISQSIRYLSVKSVYLDSLILSHLFKYTPHLQRLSISNINELNDQQTRPIFPSLTSVNMVIIHCSVLWLQSLIHQLPNLRYLTLQLNNISLNGYDWEKILSNYLKYIKVFRFKMTIQFSSSKDLEEQIDQLLDTFRSDYWIEKHQWFVQCEWYPIDVNKTGLLYTLPYASDTFYYTDGKRSKSTSPYKLDGSIYDRVQTLHYTYDHKNMSNRNWTSSSMQFANLRHLAIRFPLQDNFWSIIPTLDRLISLDAILNEDLDYSQLQLLLDRAPRLRSLRFCHLNDFSMAKFNIKSTSICRLEFFQKVGYDSHYFNTKDCVILARSCIASQCQVLVIDVKSRTNILELIQAMPHLQALSCHCEGDQNHRDNSTEDETNLIQWLHDHSLFNFAFTMVGYIRCTLRTNIWI